MAELYTLDHRMMAALALEMPFLRDWQPILHNEPGTVTRLLVRAWHPDARISDAKDRPEDDFTGIERLRVARAWLAGVGGVRAVPANGELLLRDLTVPGDAVAITEVIDPTQHGIRVTYRLRAVEPPETSDRQLEVEASAREVCLRLGLSAGGLLQDPAARALQDQLDVVLGPQASALKRLAARDEIDYTADDLVDMDDRNAGASPASPSAAKAPPAGDNGAVASRSERKIPRMPVPTPADTSSGPVARTPDSVTTTPKKKRRTASPGRPVAVKEPAPPSKLPTPGGGHIVDPITTGEDLFSGSDDDAPARRLEPPPPEEAPDLEIPDEQAQRRLQGSANGMPGVTVSRSMDAETAKEVPETYQQLLERMENVLGALPQYLLEDRERLQDYESRIRGLIASMQNRRSIPSGARDGLREIEEEIGYEETAEDD